MKQLLGIATVITALAAGASAQTTVKSFYFAGSASNVMGKVVKGAPYSADEITEVSQTLADGTHIKRQNQVTVYRDGEGRVRRDTGGQITIWDPVAGLSYVLDPQAKTAVRSTMARLADDGYNKIGVAYTSNGSGDQSSAVEKKLKVMEDQMQASMEQKLKEMQDQMQTSSGAVVMVDGAPANAEAMAKAKAELAASMEKLQKRSDTNSARREDLGQQSFGGVTADGTRESNTIEAGAIGNDRPIAVVSERWYSTELQTVVMTKHSDPRTGDETFRLSNVRRGEPGADLFLVPPGYTVTGRK